LRKKAGAGSEIQINDGDGRIECRRSLSSGGIPLEQNILIAAAKDRFLAR